MLKLFLLIIVIFAIFIVEAEKLKDVKEKTTTYKTLHCLHLVLGIAITLIATLHGISKFTNASIYMKISGITLLSLLWIEILLGMVTKKNLKSKIKFIHKYLPILIIILIIAHLVLRKVL